MAKKNSNSLPIWYKAKFDLEGLGFGGLALALAIIVSGIPLIGWLLSLICWIALVAILLASRDSERTPPDMTKVVVAPCDGIVTDVATVAPPRELRWDVPEVFRIRIASSPFTANGMRSPLSGSVESFIEEEGAPSALASDPDESDLREAFILVTGDDGVAGVRLATGGLGPRLDIDLEAGDNVRIGRKIGVRRLGGWCDVFLPIGAETRLLTGQTVIGGETIISSLEYVAYEHTPYTSPAPTVPAEIEEPVAEESVLETVAPDVDPAEPEKSDSKATAIEVEPETPEVLDGVAPEAEPGDVASEPVEAEKPAVAEEKPKPKRKPRARTTKPKPKA